MLFDLYDVATTAESSSLIDARLMLTSDDVFCSLTNDDDVEGSKGGLNGE